MHLHVCCGSTETPRGEVIDFEQLKIENQTLNKKIEERHEELHKLRKKTVITVQVRLALAHAAAGRRTLLSSPTISPGNAKILAFHFDLFGGPSQRGYTLGVW